MHKPQMITVSITRKGEYLMGECRHYPIVAVGKNLEELLEQVYITITVMLLPAESDEHMTIALQLDN